MNSFPIEWILSSIRYLKSNLESNWTAIGSLNSWKWPRSTMIACILLELSWTPWPQNSLSLVAPPVLPAWLLENFLKWIWWTNLYSIQQHYPTLLLNVVSCNSMRNRSSTLESTSSNNINTRLKYLSFSQNTKLTVFFLLINSTPSNTATRILTHLWI